MTRTETPAAALPSAHQDAAVSHHVDLDPDSTTAPSRAHRHIRLLAGPAAAQSLQRGTVGRNRMYFETGQGSALSANAISASTSNLRGPRLRAGAALPAAADQHRGRLHRARYLYDGKQIIRAGLEDHFCGKLLGLPMGCDVCYTNHAEADQDDMDTLLVLLGAAGINFIWACRAPTT